MSSITRICPSQAAEAPMPMVGMAIVLVIFAASGSAMASSTTAKAPASATALASSSMAAHLSRGAPLGLEAAEHIDELRRQPDMRHYRNAALRQEMDGVGHALAAFDLDRAAFGFLDHPRRVAEGLGMAFLIGAEGHVDHDQRPLGPAHHRAAVQDHQLQRHRQRRFKPVHHHAEASRPPGGNPHTCRRSPPYGRDRR